MAKRKYKKSSKAGMPKVPIPNPKEMGRTRRFMHKAGKTAASFAQGVKTAQEKARKRELDGLAREKHRLQKDLALEKDRAEVEGLREKRDKLRRSRLGFV